MLQSQPQRWYIANTTPKQMTSQTEATQKTCSPFAMDLERIMWEDHSRKHIIIIIVCLLPHAKPQKKELSSLFTMQHLCSLKALNETTGQLYFLVWSNWPSSTKSFAFHSKMMQNLWLPKAQKELFKKVLTGPPLQLEKTESLHSRVGRSIQIFELKHTRVYKYCFF